MKITIACVGKIKEKYLTAGIEEFTKRLQPFCKLETIAIGEERMPRVTDASYQAGYFVLVYGNFCRSGTGVDDE